MGSDVDICPGSSDGQRIRPPLPRFRINGKRRGGPARRRGAWIPAEGVGGAAR